MIKKGLFFLMSFFAVGVSLYALSYLFILHPFLEYKEIATNNILWNTAFHMHFIGGAVALSIGWIQFSGKFRAKFMQWHRRIGKLYIISILLFGATSGLYLAIYANEGFPTGLGFGSLAVLWFTTTIVALLRIRSGDIKGHQKWMIRSYALTYAAVMLRLWMPLFISVFGTSQPDAYLAVSWFCWVPNLIVAEYIISNL